jgi:histidyl-tRNA synthetase
VRGGGGRTGPALRLAATDRLRGFCRVEVDTSGRSLKAQIKSANLRRARLLIVAGEDEMVQETLQLKDLDTGEQQTVAKAQILAAVREVLEK